MCSTAGVAALARRYVRRDAPFASTLLLPEAPADAIRKGYEPPPRLPERVEMVMRACASLADRSFGLKRLMPREERARADLIGSAHF